MTEKYISFRKAGEMLGVSEKTVLNYVSMGKLTADGEREKRKVLLSSVTSRLLEFENKRESSLERLPLISLKLDLVDLTEGVKGSFLFYYDEEVKKIYELPPQKRGGGAEKVSKQNKRRL